MFSGSRESVHWERMGNRSEFIKLAISLFSHLDSHHYKGILNFREDKKCYKIFSGHYHVLKDSIKFKIFWNI